MLEQLLLLLWWQPGPRRLHGDHRLRGIIVCLVGGGASGIASHLLGCKQVRLGVMSMRRSTMFAVECTGRLYGVSVV